MASATGLIASDSDDGLDVAGVEDGAQPVGELCGNGAVGASLRDGRGPCRHDVIGPLPV